MPRNALALLAVAVLSVLIDGAAPAAARAGERWRRPLPGGAVVGAFSFERSAPYVRGRRRGVDLSGRPGAPVLAACSGTVRHAGRVPGFSRGVTLRCGRLVATELGLSKVTVTRGARVRSGAPVGVLWRGAVLRLGARLAADRQGYVDPAALLGAPTPTLAPPPSSWRRHRRPAPPLTTAAIRRAAPAPAPPRWPIVAGLGLFAAGLGGGGAVRRRRGRRARAGMALAQR
jgi:hypothetical protein